MKTIKAFFQLDCKHAFTEICNHAFMSYGARLEEALRLAGKDRAFLAQALGVSVQSIGQVIQGKTKAHTAENCAIAAKALNVDFYWLATGDGVPRAEELPMRKERDALSVEAIKHALAFDQLTDGGRRTWRTLLMTVRSAVSDAHVERTVPLPPDFPSSNDETPAADRLKAYKKKRLDYTGPSQGKSLSPHLIGNVGPIPQENKRVGNKNK